MLKKISATGNPGCTLFNSECIISAGNTLRIGPAMTALDGIVSVAVFGDVDLGYNNGSLAAMNSAPSVRGVLNIIKIRAPYVSTYAVRKVSENNASGARKLTQWPRACDLAYIRCIRKLALRNIGHAVAYLEQAISSVPMQRAQC